VVPPLPPPPCARAPQRDDALLRSINGRRDKFGAEMYTVVNLENVGYML
jgi:hypothetical protein